MYSRWLKSPHGASGYLRAPGKARNILPNQAGNVVVGDRLTRFCVPIVAMWRVSGSRLHPPKPPRQTPRARSSLHDESPDDRQPGCLRTTMILPCFLCVKPLPVTACAVFLRSNRGVTTLCVSSKTSVFSFVCAVQRGQQLFLYV